MQTSALKLKRPGACLALAVLCASLLLSPSFLVAQTTYTWTGGSFMNAEFSNSDNWLDGSAPPQLTSGFWQSLVFGQSEYGITDLTNTLSPVRLHDLTFSKDADAYEILGGTWWLRGNNISRAIRNLSQHEQVFGDTTFTLDGADYTFDTGYAGIRLDATIAYQSGRGRIAKRGTGTLALTGSNAGFRMFEIFAGTVELDVSSGYIHNTSSVDNALSLMGGQLRVIGDEWGDTDMNLGKFGGMNILGVLFYPVGSSKSNRIAVDGNGDGTYRTQITFSQWEGHSLTPGREYTGNGIVVRTTTLNFNLNKNAGIHFDSLQSGILGVDNVIYWSTTTTTAPDGSNRLTGFTQMVGNVDDGYDVTRYDDYTALPSNQSGITGGHYYINGNHTIAGTSVSGANAARTLTLAGTGAFNITDNSFFVGNLLLQEGNGDYHINIEASPTLRYINSTNLGSDAQQLQRSQTLTIHQYRTTGDLVINDGGISAARLVTTGPGTIRLRTGNFQSFTQVYVQEGKLQFEGNGANLLTEVNTYGTVAGSSSVGTGAALVRIYEGGTVDATPTSHLTESGLRGLQIQGSLQLDSGSSFLMNLTSDVIANNYTPLRVTVTPTIADATESTFGVDLKLVLQAHLTSESWITLLTTDGIVTGTFATVNGNAFGAGNHFVLSYDNIDYDAWVHYNYDLGGGLNGIVLQAIPEPTTITLLIGLLLSGCVYIRRRGRIA